MGLTGTGACFFRLGNFVNWVHFNSKYWGEKILIVLQGITLLAASNCLDLLGFSYFFFLSLNWKQASAYTSQEVPLQKELGHPSIAGKTALTSIAFRLTLSKLYFTTFVGFSVRSVVSTSAGIVFCWIFIGYAFTTGVSFPSKFMRYLSVDGTQPEVHIERYFSFPSRFFAHMYWMNPEYIGCLLQSNQHLGNGR